MKLFLFVCPVILSFSGSEREFFYHSHDYLGQCITLLPYCQGLSLISFHLLFPESSPLPPGHYIQSGAYLKVKVEVAYPLVTPTQLAAKVDVEPTIEVTGLCCLC